MNSRIPGSMSSVSRLASSVASLRSCCSAPFTVIRFSAAAMDVALPAPSCASNEDRSPRLRASASMTLRERMSKAPSNCDLALPVRPRRSSSLSAVTKALSFCEKPKNLALMSACVWLSPMALYRPSSTLSSLSSGLNTSSMVWRKPVATVDALRPALRRVEAAARYCSADRLNDFATPAERPMMVCRSEPVSFEMLTACVSTLPMVAGSSES